MPVNKNALIRYRTIDQCLINRQRKWTLLDLMEACTEALYEYEGIRKPVSKRTTQLDLQMMRSDRLGYSAPIIVVERKYYTYEDPSYSISNLPLTEGDLTRLSEVTDILKQFKGFSHFRDIEGMLKKLEDKIEVAQSHRKPIIDFDRNEQLQGLEYLDPLYNSILKKEVIKISYRPFRRSEEVVVVMHPYLLKDYRSRWYIVGFNEERRRISILALDRFQNLEIANRVKYIENNFFDPKAYFKDVIGMTVDLKSESKEVILYVLPGKAPYILTKPIHPSQKIIGEFEGGILIALQVKINYELRNLLMGWGDTVLVLKPSSLRESLRQKFLEAHDFYQNKDLISSLWRFLND